MTLIATYPFGPDWLFLLPSTPHTPRPAPIPLSAGRGHQS